MYPQLRRQLGWAALLAFLPAAWRAGQVAGKGGRGMDLSGPAASRHLGTVASLPDGGCRQGLEFGGCIRPPPSPLPFSATPLKVSSARRLPASAWRRLSLQSMGTRHRPRAAAVHGGDLGGSTPDLAGLLALPPFGGGSRGQGVPRCRLCVCAAPGVTLGSLSPGRAAGGGGWLCPQAVLRGARLFPKQQLHFHGPSQNPGIPDPECPQMMFDPGGLSFGAVEGENGRGGLCVCSTSPPRPRRGRACRCLKKPVFKSASWFGESQLGAGGGWRHTRAAVQATASGHRPGLPRRDSVSPNPSANPLLVPPPVGLGWVTGVALGDPTVTTQDHDHHSRTTAWR